MLNADRDLYQALVDKRTLLSEDPESKGFSDAVKSYEENILQVRDRMQAAKQIYDQKRSDYETLQHKDTKNLFSKRSIALTRTSRYGMWKRQRSSIALRLMTESAQRSLF